VEAAGSGHRHRLPAWGLFNKVIIADSVAPWANEVFDSASAVSCLDAWRGAIAYTMQLYFDFAGYSDMAIGLALMFNVRLPDNFNNPYQAAGHHRLLAPLAHDAVSFFSAITCTSRWAAIAKARYGGTSTCC